jgi:hypothetical protein
MPGSSDALTQESQLGGTNLPIHEKDISHLADFPSWLPGRTWTQWADIEIVDGQLKMARHRDFEFFSDEPAVVGGRDRYPEPLTYLAAAVGF